MPNYQDYPPHYYPESYSICIGKIDSSQDKEWTRYYNYPSIGIMFSYIRPGNDSIFGQEFAIMPYFEINPPMGFFNHFHLKVGLGCSYFTRCYNINRIPRIRQLVQDLIGHFNQICIIVFVSKKIMLMIGGGFMHSSNGHTQLPNYGINSFTLCVASKYLLNS